MIYLVDASVYVFRAYYSVPDTMTDPDGNPVNALYGFARFLMQMLDAAKPAHVGIAFDESLTTSFRNEIYPGYKANREPAPVDLKMQFVWCRELTRAFGIVDFGSPTHEADDIIGTITHLMRQQGHASVIVTRDKDLAQLLRAGDEYWDFANNNRYAYEDIRDAFGARPEQIADLLALMGDSVDNIPGVPGVGKKTAEALMSHFESLDDLYANLDRVVEVPVRGAKTLGEKLGKNKDAAYLARRLTEIALDMPLDVSEQTLRRRRPDVEQLNELYDRAGFGGAIRSHTQRIAKNFSDTPPS